MVAAYVFLSALLSWWFWDRFPVDCRCRWRFAKYFDRQVLVMLGIAMFKTSVDIIRCGPSWGSPSSRKPEEASKCHWWLGSFNVSEAWLPVNLGLYLGLAAISFGYLEYLLWQGEASTRSSSCEMVSLQNTASNPSSVEPA
eukprot:SRR837773.2715.p3 GENE.SRR837773.2715~~SRR837773.2715.p3  ORF type:complete len:141 (-),score=14.50 SRR837773.2715:49-471(-)